jgi:hypothetical protein
VDVLLLMGTLAEVGTQDGSVHTVTRGAAASNAVRMWSKRGHGSAATREYCGDGNVDEDGSALAVEQVVVVASAVSAVRVAEVGSTGSVSCADEELAAEEVVDAGVVAGGAAVQVLTFVTEELAEVARVAPGVIAVPEVRCLGELAWRALRSLSRRAVSMQVVLLSASLAELARKARSFRKSASE